ncbi:MAG: glycosyltransferase [Lautropia sp.]
MKLLFVITKFGVGGAERMLLRLVEGLAPRFDPVVVSLSRETDEDSLAPAFQRTGAVVHTLDMTGLASAPAGVARLASLVRRHRPAVVNTWLYHADLVGGLGARMGGCATVAWNIRNSNLSRETSPAGTRAVVRLNAALSWQLPRRILCCSEQARQIHIDIGYDPARFELIPNGFDLERFRIDRAAATEIRDELHIAHDAPLIGMVARYDPQKNHAGFIDAAARLVRDLPHARFILAGRGCEPSNTALTDLIGRAGLTDAFRLLGRRDDIARVTAALDVATLTSVYGEAFPNVLAEAMACGVPCVSTDVGDARQIVGDTGHVVAPRDTEALVAGWRDLLGRSHDERMALAVRARSRISGHFDLAAVRRRYERAFDELAADTQLARA